MNKKDFFLKLCEEGAKEKKIDLSLKEYKERFEYEIEVIEGGKLFDYFLIIWDIVRFANESKIRVGIGRGSSSGSLVCYLLNITKINPLKYGLIFERFLNPSRAKMGNPADIDIDFQSSRRDEVIEYIKDKYGHDCVANIPTVVRMGVKSALRDLARIHSVPMVRVNSVTKKIPDQMPYDLAIKIPEVKSFCEEYPRIGRLLPQLIGTIRQSSSHAAGIVITPGPISDYVAFRKVSGTMCTCFDKDIIEEMGLLKADILGLKTLDVVEDTVRFVKEQQGVDVEIPLEFNDPDVYKFIQEESLLGVFQFETANLTEYAKKVYIDSFKLLYDTTSIARPGASHSGDAEKYIKRKHGKDFEYQHHLLEDILGDTFGLIVYQEQIMQIVHKLAGFSLTKAEKIRKLVSKSKGVEELDRHKQQFINGCKWTSKIKEEVAEEIWASIREAGAYSFPMGHAVAYSGISYQTAWLKRYYPKEFLTAFLCQETGSQMMEAIKELRELGYIVKTPDINESKDRATINEKGEIILGLCDVDGFGDKAYKELLRIRHESSILSFEDFFTRRTPKIINVRIVRNLIMAGAFDDFERRDKLFYDVSPDEKREEWESNLMQIKQLEVLDMPPKIPIINLYDDPFDFVEQIKISDINWEDVQDEVYIKGVIMNLKIKTGYGFMDVNDGSGTANILLSEEVLERFKEIIETGYPVLIKAHMARGRMRLYADMILPFEDYEKYENESKYIKGEREEELEDYKNYAKKRIGLIVSANYFVSKRKNKGCRIHFSDGEDLMDFEELNSPLLSGDIIEYKITKKPFIKIISRF